MTCYCFCFCKNQWQLFYNLYCPYKNNIKTLNDKDSGMILSIQSLPTLHILLSVSTVGKYFPISDEAPVAGDYQPGSISQGLTLALAIVRPASPSPYDALWDNCCTKRPSDTNY